MRACVEGGQLVRVRRNALVEMDPAGARWARDQRVHLARVRSDAETLRGPHWFARETAALLYGWPVWRCAETPVIVRASRAGRRAASDRVCSYSTLEDSDRSELVVQCEDPACDDVHVLPVTSRLRTAVDCARLLPPLDALVALDGALRDGVPADKLRERLDDLGPARGVRRARVVIEHADARSESAGETWVRWVAVANGLPKPHLQFPVVTNDGTFWPDGGWPEVGVAWEYDGRRKYGTREQEVMDTLFAEKSRHEAITETEIRHLLRFHAQHLPDPGAAVRRFRRVIAPDFWGRPIALLDPVRHV